MMMKKMKFKSKLNKLMKKSVIKIKVEINKMN